MTETKMGTSIIDNFLLIFPPHNLFSLLMSQSSANPYLYLIPIISHCLRGKGRIRLFAHSSSLSAKHICWGRRIYCWRRAICVAEIFLCPVLTFSTRSCLCMKYFSRQCVHKPSHKTRLIMNTLSLSDRQNRREIDTLQGGRQIDQCFYQYTQEYP